MPSGRKPIPEGPRIEKIQSREAILKKSSFQYGMKISIENEIFIPGSSLTAATQGPGLNFSIENEIFKPRMKISSENENFVRGGTFFFHAFERERVFSILGPLGITCSFFRTVLNGAGADGVGVKFRICSASCRRQSYTGKKQVTTTTKSLAIPIFF